MARRVWYCEDVLSGNLDVLLVHLDASWRLAEVGVGVTEVAQSVSHARAIPDLSGDLKL